MKRYLCVEDSYALSKRKPKYTKIRYFSLLAVLSLMCLYAHAQSPESSGVALMGFVTDSANIPIEGASVFIKGSNVNTTTDINGKFELSSPAHTGVVTARHLGYLSESMEYTSTNAKSIHLILIPNENMLQEVEVSTGYQTIPKERATGSFVQIDNELLNRSVSSNILDRLNGVASGVLFDKSTGNASWFSIRGRSTIFANTEPLIIVDNFPYDGDLSTINPNDVESV